MNLFKRMASYYEILEYPLEIIKLRDLRRSIMPRLNGKILEIGAGTGKNLEYYPKNANLTLTDPNYLMLNKAKSKAIKLNINARFFNMSAEKLEFKNNSFDTVISTLVLCSVNYPLLSLKEIKRICKNNGTIVLLEHVRSKNKYIYNIQKLIQPMFTTFFGCHPDRDLLSYIEKANLKPTSIRNVWLNGIFKEIIIKNKKN